MRGGCCCNHDDIVTGSQGKTVYCRDPERPVLRLGTGPSTGRSGVSDGSGASKSEGPNLPILNLLSIYVNCRLKITTMLIGPSPIHRDPSYSTSGAAHPLVALSCTSFRLPRRCLRHGQGAPCRCSPHALPWWPARDLGRHDMQVEQVPKPASTGRSKPASTGQSKSAIIRNPLLPRPKDSIVSNCRDVSSCLHDGTGVFLKTNFMTAHSCTHYSALELNINSNCFSSLPSRT
jgi:hypothetical protein